MEARTRRWLITGTVPFLLLTIGWLRADTVRSKDLVPPNFKPDPCSVQRYGPAYRYPQAGWIVLHIEGEPYDRGVQHGRLLAPEIADYVRCLATIQSPKAPADGWRHTRTLVNALFLRRYHQEFLEEMKGIADGASAAGARFDGRPIDLLDVIALNGWPEIDSLGSALKATATGLEGRRWPQEMPADMSTPKHEHCSAFAATGPATADGKIVFGHITMTDLYSSSFYNVWLDVKPTRGHRVFMQSYPGGIQSAVDYYFNDAGLLVTETTLAQTKFDSTGLTLASRIRQTLQYADSIDQAVAILKEGNNGLYTNEWLLGDIKTNEVAMFELGTHKTRLYRSSKGDWFGGTKGFYWGCNNTKDLDVRLETIASTAGRPENAVFHPSDRDRKWLELYDRHKGKIDAEFGKLAFTTPPLDAHSSLDAKFTTSDLAKELKSWALFGPPSGQTWQPTFEERQKYPEIRPLVSNPWVVLHAGAPEGKAPQLAIDLPNVETGKRPVDKQKEPSETTTVAAWHGTLLPQSDADIWLVSAFAAYEPIAALDNALRKKDGTSLTLADRDLLAVQLFAHKTNYSLGSRTAVETPLNQTRSDLRRDGWYRVASGKGVLLLHELRGRVGSKKFDAMMDEFGQSNAGKPVSAEQFIEHVEKATGQSLKDFFKPWLEEKGLPSQFIDKEECGPFSVLTFLNEPEDTLIVYGTVDDVNTNREAAEALQRAIRDRHSNFTVSMRADSNVSDEELKHHHLILIGRPETNAAVSRLKPNLPVCFGSRSFVVRNETYAHAGSAVLVAAENPLNSRYSLVLVAGMGPAATLRVAPMLAAQEQRPAEVVVYPAGAEPRAMAIMAKKLVHEDDSDNYELKGDVKTIDFDSKYLGESREVKVYLPPGHDRKKRYPVVYSVDGLDGVACDLLEPLITSGKVPPFIVVSTVQGFGGMRQREYCPGWQGGKEAFAAHEKFFIKEVIPWAEKEWGASPERKDRALRGSSNGGPFVLTMANRYPELFGHVFAMMVYGLKFDIFERELKEQSKDPTHYILVAGSKDAHGVKSNQKVEELLKKKKFPVSLAVIEGAGHTSAFCQEQLVDCVQAAFGNKQYQPSGQTAAKSSDQTANRISSSDNTVRHRSIRIPEAEAAVAKAIRKLGGEVQIEGKSVVGVDLGQKTLTDTQLKELAKHLRDLKDLQDVLLVGCARVTDEGLKELFKGLKDLKMFRVLYLGSTGITDAGLKELTELKGLRQLGLANTKVTNAGLKEIKHLEKLQTLFLANTEVTDEGLKELKELKALRQLILSGCDKVTDTGAVDLKKSLPKLEIVR